MSQGLFVALLGTLFALASLVNTEVTILSVTGFSWLAIIGILILVLGILECIDAIFSIEICDFMQRMNAGVLDVVFGVLLLFGFSDTPDRLSLMIALYLLARSLLRALFAIKLKIPQLGINLLASVISFLLGLMVWLEWPTYESWFFSFSLSINLAFRELLMIFFGLQIRQQH
jgi:uncharacterized membrane protein HdeD (DUF308 family)